MQPQLLIRPIVVALRATLDRRVLAFGACLHRAGVVRVSQRFLQPSFVKPNRRPDLPAPLVQAALPGPLVWALLQPLRHVASILLGRHLRRWWRLLPAEKRATLTSRNTVFILAAAALGLAYLLVHADTVPITGRRRVLVFTSHQFEHLSELQLQGLMEEHGENILPADNPWHKFVSAVLQHIVSRNTDIPQISAVAWKVNVVDAPEQNALVLANGHVFVFTGMLSITCDANQLATILSHEMAHAILGHSLERASYLHLQEMLSLVVVTILWATLPFDSIAAFLHWAQGKACKVLCELPHSRLMEQEADEVGLQLMAKACLDVRSSSAFWEQIQLQRELKGEEQLPRWLSTHPTFLQRAEVIDTLIPKALELSKQCLCPPLPERDPRTPVRIARELVGLSGPLAVKQLRPSQPVSKGTAPDLSRPPVKVVRGVTA
uniref:metalloendopeptidase OMA1, mitochondrial isoform X2 n=1 Tax=Myxine glutinosa TaxID=7769 RepID=UPI00358F6E93